jgi:putative ATP-dependent endonuclease of OLD family
MASRGDLLFSRALILFEGETEEQALPIYAENFWGATAHEKGFSFVGCGGGTNYYPFIWLAKNFGMRWYVLSDGEERIVASLNGQLKRMGLDPAEKLANISIIDDKTNYEGHLISSGYMDAIEKAFEETLGAGALDKYIADLDGKSKGKIDGKEVLRDYKGAEGRKRAAVDLLENRKTRLASPVATGIVGLADKSRRIPPAIRKLFDRIAEDLKGD